MLAFDLPDYSKSSTAQNEKSARERVKKRWEEEEEGILQGPRYPSRLSAKPNSSSFASCFQEIWCGCDVWVRGDTIRTVANMAAEEKKERRREGKKESDKDTFE